MTKKELLKIAKPILFNTEMVKAILEGRKTVTRRVIKPQPRKDLTYPLGWSYTTHKRGAFGWGEHECGGTIDMAKPRYHKGDILYVRETFFVDDCTPDCAGRMNEDECPFIRVGDKCYGYKTQYVGGRFGGIKWRPSIHMPKEAARIFLRVTSVKVERLWNITEKQAIKEGCIGVKDGKGNIIISARGNFHALWDKTTQSKDLDCYGWESNPWVWVYEFERIGV